jgi:hypothetical protein
VQKVVTSRTALIIAVKVVKLPENARLSVNNAPGRLNYWSGPIFFKYSIVVAQLLFRLLHLPPKFETFQLWLQLLSSPSVGARVPVLSKNLEVRKSKNPCLDT